MRICLFCPVKDVYSETFIRAHIQHLPATIPLYGGWPLWEYEGRPIIPGAYRAGMRYGGRVHRVLETAAKRGASRRLACFLRKRADVVLAEYGDTAAQLVEPCRLANIPLVAHFHGYDAYHRDTLSKQAGEYRRLFANAEAIIVGSRAMSSHLQTLGAPPDRLFYNPCGVDLNTFTPADPSRNRPHFVAAGRFVDKKAPYITLLAFERVLQACPEVQLHYAGEGYLLDACKQLARALGIAHAVSFHGASTQEQVAALMRISRAFVQHSVTTTYGDSEGTGITVLEAGATGLPVVSTRHGGIQDTVLPGETGFLVDELDIAGMANSMLILAKDPTRAAAMGRRARQHVSAHYSLDRSIQALRRILHDAASRHTMRGFGQATNP
jgi:glycosyltransferase involved in cell wall biosynthesis